MLGSERYFVYVARGLTLSLFYQLPQDNNDEDLESVTEEAAEEAAIPVPAFLMEMREERKSKNRKTAEHFFCAAGVRAVCLACHPHFVPGDETTNIKTYKIGSRGYTWAMQHLEACHPRALEQYELFVAGQGDTGLPPNVSERAADTYHWLNWIIAENLPLTFVESPYARQHCGTTLTEMSARTLTRRLYALIEVMQDKLSDILPHQFGIMLDGWSNQRQHFCGLYAVGPGVPNDGYVLLLFGVFNSSGQTALDHQEFIINALERCGRSQDSVLFICADHATVNKKLACDLEVPMIGCAAHRLNLAMNRQLCLGVADNKVGHLSNKEMLVRCLLQKADAVMALMMHSKNIHALGQLTHLKPIRPNNTRWNGALFMGRRYVKLDEHFMALSRHDTPLGRKLRVMMLNSDELIELKSALEMLENVHHCSVELQRSHVTMLEARDLFDFLIEKYGSHFEHYLAADATIVPSPKFESAIVKAMIKTDELSFEEESEIRHFIDHSRNQVSESEMEGLNPAQQVAHKRRRLLATRRYVGLEDIPSSNAHVERLFSAAGQVRTATRNRLVSKTFGAVMFWQVNSAMIQPEDMQRAITSQYYASTLEEGDLINPDNEEESVYEHHEVEFVSDDI